MANLDFAPRNLIGGMYLPLAYWDLLAASPVTDGPRGGTIFSYDNVSRRLGNDLFVNLVHGGWVGSRAESTEAMTEIVGQGLDAGRSVTVAEAWDADEYLYTD